MIIGAGPFGLAMAAQAKRLGIEHVMVGRPMSFWREHMPVGMCLRSACDWHLDPADESTIESYLRTLGKTPTDVEPSSLGFYLEYAQWSQKQQDIRPMPLHVRRLDRVSADGCNHFQATLEDDEVTVARRVVVAVGFRYFKHVPQSLLERLPAEQRAHTCNLVDLASLRSQSSQLMHAALMSPTLIDMPARSTPCAVRPC